MTYTKTTHGSFGGDSPVVVFDCDADHLPDFDDHEEADLFARQAYADATM